MWPKHDDSARDRLKAQGFSDTEIKVLLKLCRYLERPLAALSKRECEGHLALVYTMPQPWRSDPERLLAQLQLAVMALGVLPRCEVQTLIESSPMVAAQLRRMVSGDDLASWESVTGVRDLLLSLLGEKQ